MFRNRYIHTDILYMLIVYPLYKSCISFSYRRYTNTYRNADCWREMGSYGVGKVKGGRGELVDVINVLSFPPPPPLPIDKEVLYTIYISYCRYKHLQLRSRRKTNSFSPIVYIAPAYIYHLVNIMYMFRGSLDAAICY